MTNEDTFGLVTGSTRIFLRAASVTNKKNCFLYITRIKIHHQLVDPSKELFSTEVHWKIFCLHNFIRLQFQKEAWSGDMARRER